MMTTPTRSLPRWHWQNWPVLVKLIVVLLVPTVVALVVGALRVVDQAGAAPAYDRIVAVAGVQQQLSGLMGALQQERDLAAAYVASGREGDRAALESQFRAVDDAVTDVRAAAAGIEGLESTGYRQALDRLGGLTPLRQNVLVGSDPADVAVSEYGAAIEPLLEVDAAFSRQFDDVAVSGQGAALHALVSAREQVARQHALILAALITDEMDAGTIDAVRAAGVRLQAELAAFSAALRVDERARYAEPVTGEAEQARQRIIRLVVDRGLAQEPPATPIADWDARTSAVVAPMVEAEQALRDRVRSTATALGDDARSTAGWNSVVLLFTLALGVLVGYLIARSMLRPLGVLRRTALDVADHRLPAAVAAVRGGSAPAAVEPVPVHTDEEIGQVARAFDAVHVQAVRLAAEQAQLRANVNDMFVNLSRRSQGLVQRQLKLIDQLERSEESPEALDNLFQLDHLATRMRRNNENLLVLAGTESAKRSGRPVPLVDVLRAAVSEVEQYQRLVLQPPPDVLVLGRATNDLVHLLAELLDNATMFSPPDSQVMISAQELEDGSVTIDVDDRGVGMGDAELAEANKRLAASPRVDASVSRRMGLFVVGRLASRHGIGVTMRRGGDGVGLTAAVAMPSRLVCAAESMAAGADEGALVPGPTNGSVPRHGPGGAVGVQNELTGGASTPFNGTTSSGPTSTGPGGTGPGGNGVYGPGTDPLGDRAPTPPPGAAPELPRRTPDPPAVDRPLIGGPPPAPPSPPIRPPLVSPPAATQERSSGPDLFRSAAEQEGVPAGPLGSQRVAQRAMLQDATPIFDDVASAWFQENKPVPWAEQGEAAAPTTPPGPGTPEHAEREGAPSVFGQQQRDALLQRSAQPALAHQVQPPRGADWGLADPGWHAAEALARPTGGEVTSAGLPRRRPRAHLVPGAADASEPAGADAPARSAEAIRGRLASHQRGVREGRQVRRSQHQGAGDQDQQHGPDEVRQ